MDVLPLESKFDRFVVLLETDGAWWNTIMMEVACVVGRLAWLGSLSHHAAESVASMGRGEALSTWWFHQPENSEETAEGDLGASNDAVGLVVPDESSRRALLGGRDERFRLQAAYDGRAQGTPKVLCSPGVSGSGGEFQLLGGLPSLRHARRVSASQPQGILGWQRLRDGNSFGIVPRRAGRGIPGLVWVTSTP